MGIAYLVLRKTNNCLQWVGQSAGKPHKAKVTNLNPSTPSCVDMLKKEKKKKKKKENN
jgi:hypothetical protein